MHPRFAPIVLACATLAASDADAQSVPDRNAIATRFAADPQAATLALGLFDIDSVVADVLPAQRFDGGYRGRIWLVPALPVGNARKHLAWGGGRAERL
jgi:hypothetical protein